MRLKLCIVGILTSLALLLPGTAAPHLPGNCSKTTKYWQVWSYGNYIYYRQMYLGASSLTNNGVIHHYRTDSTPGGKIPWRVVDRHDRPCNLS